MSSAVASVEDLRERSRRRLPVALFEYIDGGADGEVTACANRAAFDAVELRPRIGVSVSVRRLSTTPLGDELSVPVMLAPCGFVGLMHRDGESGAARAAAAAGSVFIASTLSLQPLEEIARAAPGRTWLQLYMVGGREAAEQLIARAQAAAVRVLVVTVDTAVAGYRERDVRNGLPLLTSPGPVRPRIAHLAQFARRPGWIWSHVRARRPLQIPNVVDRHGRPLALAQVGPELSLSAVSWEDLVWLREAWKGPLVVKGVLESDDARRALDRGADGLVVSNHGGRQLDRVAPSLTALPAVVEAVDGRGQVFVDTGIARLSFGARTRSRTPSDASTADVKP